MVTMKQFDKFVEDVKALVKEYKGLGCPKEVSKEEVLNALRVIQTYASTMDPADKFNPLSEVVQEVYETLSGRVYPYMNSVWRWGFEAVRPALNGWDGTAEEALKICTALKEQMKDKKI